MEKLASFACSSGALRLTMDAVELARVVLGRALDNFMRGLGIALLVLGTLLVIFITYVYFSVPLLNPGFPVYVQLGTTSLGLWILFNILFNWWYCYSTSPGHPSHEKGKYAPKMCHKCNAPKPLRCHHCSVCGKCVLAMDHHCPWMANCVGFYNYRYFYLFLVYMCSGCVFCVAVISASHPIIDVTFYGKIPASGRVMPGSVVFVFIVTVSVSIAVGILLAWHTYLVMSAQTTIEFYKNRSRRGARVHRGEVFVNEFDMGRRKNWQSVFGPQRAFLSWTLPTTRRRDGDGETWGLVRGQVV